MPRDIPDVIRGPSFRLRASAICICKCMYKALTNLIMQSLAVPLRHRVDFRDK